jgi:hypothetical protein
MKRHWSHSCITSIQIQLPCLQWNATGPTPVSHQSRSSFRVYKETPLVPIIDHTKQDSIFNPAFFKYILILIKRLRPSLPRVSFPSGFRTQPYLLHSNKLHLLSNIYRNVRLRFLQSVSALTEPSSGKKFKVNSLKSVTHTRVFLLVHDIVVQDTDWPVRQWSLYIVNTLWWKCLLTQAFHVQSLAL